MTHMFDMRCRENRIEHRLTKIGHPWTNGQVERMDRTLKEATIKRYHYASHDQLREHLDTFVNAYNFAKRLKTLKGLTVFEYVNKCWTEDPKLFNVDPCHHFPGLYTYCSLPVTRSSDIGFFSDCDAWQVSSNGDLKSEGKAFISSHGFCWTVF